jgi:outer membrane protein assembly factor BamB
MKRTLGFLLLVAAAHAQNWPQYRGPRATGVLDGANPPAVWNVEKKQNVLWRTEIPGLSVASPVIWGEKVFITTAISSDPASGLRHGLYGDVEPHKDVTKHTWKVYALDRKSGKILWEHVAHEGVPKTKRHPKSTQNNSTPATDGRYLAVLFGSEGLFCYDLNGKLLWKKDIGLLNAGWFYDPDYEWGHAASPIIYKDLVIIQADRQKDSFIAAYNIKDGKQVWLTQRDEIPSWATPTVYDGPPRAELITHATKFIRGYDPMTGKELWRLGPNSEVTAPTPFEAHGLIFVTNGYRVIQPIYAIKPGGSGDISPKGDTETSDFVAWSKKKGGPYMPTPVVYGDLLYVVSNNGVLTAYQAKTGERVYQQRLGDKGGAYSASPIAGDGKVIFTSEDGEIYVVKAGPKYELLGTSQMNEVCMATPALSPEVMVVRTMKAVYGIGNAKRN